jgi:PhoH-like ATPase
MKKKNFVLDSNVLINDPLCFYKFEENDITIPLIVLEEIDSFKKEESSRAQSSRQINRELDKLRELGTLNKGVKLSNGGTLRVEDSCPEPVFTKTTGKAYNDNVILQTILNLKEKNKRINYILVTKDINLRVRADSLGIPAQDYENMKVDDVSFYDPVRTLFLPDEDVDLIFKEGGIPCDLEVGQNTNFVVKSESSNKSALAVYKSGCLYNVRSGEEAYGLKPRNKEQAFALDVLMDEDIHLVVLTGAAGVGKSLVCLAAGLEQVVNQGSYEKVLVSRPVIPMGKDIGFLPGTEREKIDPWLGPIYDSYEFLSRNAVKNMRGREGLDQLEHFGKFEIQVLTYIRGRSISNSFIMIDEVQNLTRHEMKTILTRAGKGSKIVLTGDVFQIDNPYLDIYSNGLTYVIDKLRGEKIFAHVHLTKGERSALAELAAEKL